MQGRSEIEDLMVSQLRTESNKTLEALNIWEYRLLRRVKKSVEELRQLLPSDFSQRLPEVEQKIKEFDDYFTKYANITAQFFSQLISMELETNTRNVYLEAIQSIQGKLKKDEQIIQNLEFIFQQTRVNNSISYQFSQELKAPDIVLLSPNKIRSESNQGKIALIEPPFRKNEGIQKICLKGGTLYGVCHLNIVRQNGWDFTGSSLGHGVYVAQHQGFTWSHSNNQQNEKRTDFKFTEETTIYLRFDPLRETIIFENTQSGQIISLDVKLEDDLIYPCVWMYGEGDEAEIL